MFCPSETPDGQKIGLVKHLAFLTQVTNKLTDSENE
jgi:DNA-directed RNA polymerase beta subunit